MVEGSTILVIVSGAAVTLLATFWARRERKPEREAREQADRLMEFEESRKRLRESFPQVLNDAFGGQKLNRLHPELQLLGDPAWLLPEPVELSEIQLCAVDHDWSDSFTPFIDRWKHVWPRSPKGAPLRRYSEAIEEYAKPDNWNVDLSSFRLYGITPIPRAESISQANHVTLRLDFAIGDGRYRDAMDTQEALGYLWSAGHLRESPEDVPDPFDLSWRCASTAICTLTIVKEAASRAYFYMHWRDPKKVAISGNQFHVTPCGEFETADIGPSSQRDFDLWLSIQREYAEEFLGYSQFDGSRGSPPDYESEPFSTLMRLRDQGGIQVSCFGAGVNPITHKTELLTVAVFDGSAFESLQEVSYQNRSLQGDIDDEGTKTRAPFTQEGIDEYRRHTAIPLNPFADAILHLSWEHRKRLLGFDPQLPVGA